MKTVRTLLLPGMFLIMTGLNAQWVGDEANDFTLSASDGALYTLSEYAGQVVLIYTLGNSCSDCIAEGPFIEDFYQEFASDGRVAALGLDYWDGSSSVTTVENFILKTGISFPVLLQAGVYAIDFGSTYSRLVVVDQDGILAFVGTRPAYQDIPEARKVIQALLNTSTEISDTGIPRAFKLAQNIPNPFNPGTRIRYTLDKDGVVTLTVFNLLGQPLEVLVHAFQTKGEYSLLYEPQNLTSGVYFYRLQSGGKTITKKMILQ